MSNVFSRAYRLFVVIGGLAIGACGSPSVSSAIQSAKSAQGGELGQLSAPDVSSGPKASALSPGSYGRDARECRLDLYPAR